MVVHLDRLFSGKGDLRARLKARNETGIPNVVDSISEPKLHATDDEALVEHVYSKLYTLPIELDEQNIEMETTEIPIDVRNDPYRQVLDKSRPCLVSGLRFILSVPFTGDPVLWQDQLPVYGGSRPYGRILARPNESAGHLEMMIERPSDTLDEADVKKAIDAQMNVVRSCLGHVKREVDQANQELGQRIRSYITYRRNLLAKHAKVIQRLGIPLKARPGSPDYNILPLRRRIVKPLPAVPSDRSDPSISDEDYETILAVIRHIGRSFECSPATFAMHNEEEL